MRRGSSNVPQARIIWWHLGPPACQLVGEKKYCISSMNNQDAYYQGLKGRLWLLSSRSRFCRQNLIDFSSTWHFQRVLPILQLTASSVLLYKDLFIVGSAWPMCRLGRLLSIYNFPSLIHLFPIHNIPSLSTIWNQWARWMSTCQQNFDKIHNAKLSALHTISTHFP